MIGFIYSSWFVIGNHIAIIGRKVFGMNMQQVYQIYFQWLVAAMDHNLVKSLNIYISSWCQEFSYRRVRFIGY